MNIKWDIIRAKKKTTYLVLDFWITERKLCSNVIVKNGALVCKEAEVKVSYSEI